MLVIRRKVTRNQAYTVFMLPGFHREWPTSDYEHQEILQLFKQDRAYEGIANDFSDYRIGSAIESEPRENPSRFESPFPDAP